MSKKFAFILLNWNGEEDTKKCLKSLDAVDYAGDFDIVLVDNGSTKKSVEILKKFIKLLKRNVTFVALPVNTGFTGGHIEGLKHTDASVICLLNNDAVVAPNILDEVDNTIRVVGKSFGAIGGRAYFWNESQKAFDIWNEFFTYQKIDPYTATAYTQKGDPGESLAPKVVDTVSGACVFVNREAIKKVGYLDDMFFAYYEETDLFARFKRCGLEVYYCPTIRYWHKFEPENGSHGASSRHIKNFSTTLILRNQFFFAFKNFERSYLLRFIFWYYYRFLKSVFKIIIKPKSVNNRIIIKTSLANTARIPKLYLSRRAVSKSIPEVTGYNSKLIADAQKKTIVFTEMASDSRVQEFILSNTHENDRVHFRKSNKCSHQFKHRCMKLNASKNHLYSLAAAASRTNCIVVLESKNVKYGILVKEWNKLRSDTPSKKKLEGLFLFNRQYAFRLVGTQYSLDQDVDWTSSISRSLHTSILVKINNGVKKIFRRPANGLHLVVDYLAYRYSSGGSKELLRAVVGLFKNFILKPKSMILIIRAGAHEQRLNKLTAKTSDSLEETMKLAGFPVAEIPVFINCRDRVESLSLTIKGLLSAGFKDLYLIDNQSSYKPLLNYYDSCPYQVILLGENMGHKAPWESLAVKLLSGGKPYVVTDPDVVLPKTYNKSTIKQMLELFDVYPGYVKIGCSLSIDDIPNTYEHKKTVQKWEKQFWEKPIKTNNELVAYDAEIDTTFAIYRPNLGYITLPSIRIGGKHSAKHLPWYQDSNNPTKEEHYYREHASSAVNTWNKDSLPEYLHEYIS